MSEPLLSNLTLEKLIEQLENTKENLEEELNRRIDDQPWNHLIAQLDRLLNKIGSARKEFEAGDGANMEGAADAEAVLSRSLIDLNRIRTNVIVWAQSAEKRERDDQEAARKKAQAEKDKAKKAAAKKKPAAKVAAHGSAKKKPVRKPNPAFMAPKKPAAKQPASSLIPHPSALKKSEPLLRPAPALSALLGGVALITRSEATKRVWAYLKEHNIRRTADKKSYITDDDPALRDFANDYANLPADKINRYVSDLLSPAADEVAA